MRPKLEFNYPFAYFSLEKYSKDDIELCIASNGPKEMVYLNFDEATQIKEWLENVLNASVDDSTSFK
jgi:hypothetical protein